VTGGTRAWTARVGSNWIGDAQYVFNWNDYSPRVSNLSVALMYLASAAAHVGSPRSDLRFMGFLSLRRLRVSAHLS